MQVEKDVDGDSRSVWNASASRGGWEPGASTAETEDHSRVAATEPRHSSQSVYEPRRTVGADGFPPLPESIPYRTKSACPAGACIKGCPLGINDKEVRTPCFTGNSIFTVFPIKKKHRI